MLHALLIGINEYAPGSGVRNLSGCVNDVQAIQAFLGKNYVHLQPNIRTLLNEQATREGVIKTFREHLTGAQIKAGDFVLFYYSGHGSYSPTAPEFAYNNPSKQDETMVCCDSRLKGKQDLADKERAALLAEIPTHAQVLLIVDSCHAASSFRKSAQTAELGATRFQPGQTSPRTLESYLLADGENIYLQQKQRGERLTVPQRPYVLLAACQEDQLARETKDNRGLFTKFLLDVWENAGQEYTYQELLKRVNFYVKALNAQQDPVLETVQVSHRTTVLGDIVRPDFVRNQVIYNNGVWQIDCGAIHGMPTNPEKLQWVQVELYDSKKVPSKSPDLIKSVKQVFATYSILDFDQAEREFYWAAVDFGLKIPVNISGDKNGIQKIQHYLAMKATRSWYSAKTEDAPQYTLRHENGQCSIFAHPSSQVLYGPDADLDTINNKIRSIVRWHQLYALQNPASTIASRIEVQFCEEPQDHSAPVPIPRDQLTFKLKKKPNGEYNTLWYHLRARNTSNQPLHVALLYLSEGYGVEVHYMRRILPPHSEWVKLDETSRELGLFEKEKVMERFLVLYSTEAFEEFQYQQNELKGGPNRDLVPRNLARNDWATQLFEVQLSV